VHCSAANVVCENIEQLSLLCMMFPDFVEGQMFSHF